MYFLYSFAMLTYSHKAIHKKHYRTIQVSIPICIIQAKHNWKENTEGNSAGKHHKYISFA